MRNPKILMFFISLLTFGTSFLAWQIWQGNTWYISALSFRNLTAVSGDLLDRFDTSLNTELTMEKTAPEPVSDGMVTSPVNGSRNGAVMFYRRSNGYVDEVYVPDKSVRSISTTELPGLTGTIWSPDKQAVISVFSGNSGMKFRYFNYVTKVSYVLPTNTKSATFSPSGNQIVYFATTGDIGGVYLASPDGKNYKKILETRVSDMQLFWPSPDDIYFQTKNQSIGTWDLLKIEEGNALKTILSDQQGLELLWSRDGKLLYSSYPTDLGLELKVLDPSIGIDSHVSIYAHASHCAWSVGGKSIYCGVPENRSTYQEHFSGISPKESVYKISLTDGTSQIISNLMKSDIEFNLRQAFLSPLENYLFFVNEYDGLLYSLPLK